MLHFPQKSAPIALSLGEFEQKNRPLATKGIFSHFAKISKFSKIKKEVIEIFRPPHTYMKVFLLSSPFRMRTDVRRRLRRNNGVRLDSDHHDFGSEFFLKTHKC